MEESLKLIKNFNALFLIENPSDTRIVMYQAERKDDILLFPYVTNFYTEDFKTKEKVDPIIQEKFFGCVSAKIPNKSKYNMTINALPDKIITVHLKKSGKCVAKTILNGLECKLIKIYVESKIENKIPKLGTYFHLYGIHKKKLIIQKILIPEDLKNKLGVTSFVIAKLNPFK
jgi:hypothetical protein